MSVRSTRHTTFTLERTFSFPLAKVFSAWSSAEAKSRWFMGPQEKWKLKKRSVDFKVGGTEHLSGQFIDGPTSTYNAHYLDIVPNDRIVYTYEMELDGKRISLSMSTVEFRSVRGVTKLVYTEHTVFLDDIYDNGSRERGTADLLDRLAQSLNQTH